MGQYNLKERMLVFYLKPAFQNAPIGQLPTLKAQTDNLLDKYNVDNAAAYKYFTLSMCQVRLKQFDEAENNIARAIAQVTDGPDKYLKFVFFEYWGSIRIEKGNSIGAVYSYWMAKKEAVELNDYHSEAALDVSMSDLYYKISAYNQSLFYLNQSLTVINKHNLNEPYLLTLIYYNKAENFFALNNEDSLKVYNSKLISPVNVTYKIQTYRVRTAYYLQLLAHNYTAAIQLIKSMMGNNKLYLYSDLDKQHLADAYFMNRQNDSAKVVINELLKGPQESDNPQIKLHLYQQLAAIAEDENDDKALVYYNGLALKESQNYISSLTQVDNMSAQMQMDEIEASYLKTAKSDKTSNLILLFILTIAVLAVIVIYLFYRNIKQQHLYDILLHREERNELSFINSHMVRKYLCNILGLIDMVRESDEQDKAFLESQDFLYDSAEKLDDAIKSIAEKLDNYQPEPKR
jgi:hypothetical protein